MKKIRNRFERFCYKHRNKGIPNLMLYISLGSGLLYLFTMATNNDILYAYLMFDRERILHGQVWRLISFVLVQNYGNILLTMIGLLCYYSLGRAMENLWGTFRFNLFYFTGVVMMDVYCMLFGGQATAHYLNLSLFLGYATLYPDAHFLLFFIIPVKAWIFALFDLVVTVVDVISLSVPVFLFPYNLFPLVALLNYFLFFGKDVLNVVPLSWRSNARRLFRRRRNAPAKTGRGTIPFPNAGSFQASTATVKAPYTHRCTVCGRTDVSDPDLEFRYCSRCSGYHCYCQDHINNHDHIRE